jgi:16S rRNA (uracil1498-N3)-methyltransferase
MGIDTIVPIIGEHSERKVIKPERLEKILVSAAKQSLKGAVPVLQEQISVKDFIKKSQFSPNTIKLIAYCTNADKVSLKQILAEAAANKNATPKEVADIVILIGPEGDFSPAEVDLALSNGFKPLTLGQSRLRTETAAVFACACVYSSLGE